MQIINRINRETDIKITLILKNDEPIYQKTRRLSQAEKDIVNAQVEGWEKQGVVRLSISEFASPVVLVKKKIISIDVDYRLLNKKIIKYPLLLIKDQLDQLHESFQYA